MATIFFEEHSSEIWQEMSAAVIWQAWTSAQVLHEKNIKKKKKF